MILRITDTNGRYIEFDTKYYRPIPIQRLEEVLSTGKCSNKENVNDCKDVECLNYSHCIYKIKESTNG